MRFRCTAAAALLGMIFLTVVLGFDVDPLDVAALVHNHIGAHHLDEIAAALLVVAVGLVIDYRLAVARARAESLLKAEQARAQAEVQEQRLRVLKATMRTVQDIVNNYLNVISLQAAKGFSPDVPLDALTRETAARLRALGDLETVNERVVGGDVVIAYDVESPHRPPA